MTQHDVACRLKKALAAGREVNAESALKVLKFDLQRLLRDYFIFEPHSLMMTADVLEDGKVSLSVVLNAESFAETGKVLE